jgi:hypothetical protein
MKVFSLMLFIGFIPLVFCGDDDFPDFNCGTNDPAEKLGCLREEIKNREAGPRKI